MAFHQRWVKISKRKVAQWKNGFIKKPHYTANLNFLFLSHFVYLWKNWFSQFFSNWESAEPVFCSKELSCLPYKNQNKSLTLSFGEGKFKFAVLQGFLNPFFHCTGPPLINIVKINHCILWMHEWQFFRNWKWFWKKNVSKIENIANYTRAQRVWHGWPVYELKCLCSRGPEWGREGDFHSHQHFTIWFFRYKELVI